MLTTGYVAVDGGGKHFRESSQRHSGAVYPSPESRVMVSLGVRLHVVEEVLIRLFGALGRPRYGTIELLPNLVRDLAPHRPVPQTLQI